MDTSADKWKCGAYLLALTTAFSLLLLSYFFRGEMHTIGRITIRSEAFCAAFFPSICVSPYVTNNTECMEAMDLAVCTERLQAWEDHFNTICALPINDYLACSEAEKCAKAKERLEKCEIAVERPEWFPLPKLPEAEWLGD